MNPRRVLLMIAALAAFSIPACDSREHTNPLDPENPETHGVPANLEALAGDGEVELRWTTLELEGINGFRLWRWVEGGETLGVGQDPFPAATRSYVDTLVENGITYRYRLDYLVGSEGAAHPGLADPATPGRAEIWVLDGGGPELASVTADGRRVRGRVGEPELLSDLVIRPDDGSVWVCVETSPGGLRRYDRQGNLLRSVDGLPALDDLAYDAARDRLWALAIDERVLYRFDGEGDRVDSLSLAAMAFPRGLALDPTDGTVWVIDRAGELYPRGPDAPSTAPRSDGSTFYDAAVDPQGEGIWVTDPANRAVYFFERTVSAWPQFPWVGLGVPREIAARSHSGSLVEAWATDDAGAVAILESRSGVVTRLAGIGSPRGLFVGDEDDAWLFEGTTGALVHVDRQATGATRLVRLPSPRKVAVRTR